MTETAKSLRGTAVTLSGGGYRAMLFHLGFLWRLRDAGVLRSVDRFASVSGGSITAGMLALAWERLDWDDDGASFRRFVADPILAMSARSIDIVASLLGRIPGFNGEWVRRAYDRHLYHSAQLKQLPRWPQFIFNATSLHSGKLVRITRDHVSDWTTGRWTSGELTVADAVAASSAFPPVLSPIVFDLRYHDFEPFPDAVRDPPPKLFLTDGGVYDNLGIESVWKKHRTIYVSDAGAAFAYAKKGPFLLSTQAMQVVAIMQDQIGALRFRQMWHDLQAPAGSPDRREGFIVASDYLIAPRTAGALPYAEARALRLAAAPTRLRKFDARQARELVNWGYISTDDRLRALGTPAGLCRLPFGECPIA